MRFFYVVIIALAAAMTACSSNNAKPSSAESAPQPAATASTSAPASAVDACALFTADDAQQVLGVPMKNFPESNKGVCRYDEASPKEGTIGGNVSITINTYATPAQADLAWRQLKEVRHLQEGEKNVQKLDGMGQEAYFTGNKEKGKVGVAAVVARKDRAELMLDSMVLEYRASPDAMTSIAKRILDRLP